MIKVPPSSIWLGIEAPDVVCPVDIVQEFADVVADYCLVLFHRHYSKSSLSFCRLQLPPVLFLQ